MRKRWLWIGVAVAAGLTGLYVSYPYYTLSRLRDAIASGDRAALEALIAWPAVRAGVKEDLNAFTLRELAGRSSEEAGLAGLGSMMAGALGPLIIDRMVDAYVTPTGLAQLVSKDADGSAAGNPPDSARSRVKEARLRSSGFVGPTRFRFEVDNGRNENGPGLGGLLELEGMSWRLTRILLPAEIFAPTPNPDPQLENVISERPPEG